MISAIAVIGKNRELGAANKLVFKVPGDLPRFRSITMGHPIIMGRKTFESIGRVLPGRANIVISRDTTLVIEGATVVESIEKALELGRQAEGSEEVFVIGGGEIYNLAMPYVERLYLTVVDESAREADVFFPDYSNFTKVILDEEHEVEGVKFKYLTLAK